MAKRRSSARNAEHDERFVTRLREALSRFSDGVHTLGAPATPDAIVDSERRLAAPLPGTLADVYRFADGLWLFDELVRLRALTELARTADGWLDCGEAEHAGLRCDASGRVFEVDEDGDRVLSAASMEQALLVYLAREALLVDAEGEYKDVFGDDGELTPSVRKRRNEAARKRAPEGARWLLEAAELSLELDEDSAAAERWLQAAIEADPQAPGPHELLGLLVLGRGDLRLARAALAAAARVSGKARRAERAGIAAEAAQRDGDDAERRALAALALDSEPALVARLSSEAEAALQAGRTEDADRLSAIAAAVAGSLDALPVRLRARRQLRMVR